MKNEPEQAPAPMYVARMTEQHLACLRSFANNTETIQPLRIALSVLSDAARPEHPDRQTALEELAQACSEHYHGQLPSIKTATRVARAINKLCSLEAK